MFCSARNRHVPSVWKILVETLIAGVWCSGAHRYIIRKFWRRQGRAEQSRADISQLLTPFDVREGVS
jgi:hypothetical protein